MKDLPITNKKRYEALRILSPAEAVKAWLDGGFGIGDEPAMLEAIQKDPEISLKEEEIEEVILQAMHEEWTPEKCLAELKKR